MRAGRSLPFAARFEERAFSPPELPCPRQSLFSAVSRDLCITTRPSAWAGGTGPSARKNSLIAWLTVFGWMNGY